MRLKHTTVAENIQPTQIMRGRDEMNLCEFPIASLSKAPNSETITFRDVIFDKGKNREIERKLVISPSAKYGLPTSTDDEVIMALIQITANKQFESRVVHFTVYQLLELLGWKHSGKMYKRVRESLQRWTGVTLSYENAWWDKGKERWQSHDFHVIDNAKVVDKEGRKAGDGLSSISWNQVIYDSFKQGNLKTLDFDFFKSLESPTSRRIYRYLDKHFYKTSHRRYELEQFAFEHVGLSRNYDTAQIKRKLKDALEELEQKGFLKPLSDKERYDKNSEKKTFITLIRGAGVEGRYPVETTLSPNTLSSLEETLVIEDEQLIVNFRTWSKFKLEKETFPGGIEAWERASILEAQSR